MQIRKSLMISAAAVALTCSAIPARAADSYVSVFGGVGFLDTPKMSGKSHTFSTTYNRTRSRTVDTSFKTGFVVGANWGVDWGDFRTELELAYRGGHNSRKTARLRTSYDTKIYYKGNTYHYTGNKDTIVSSDLHMRAYSLMANVWYDFHDFDLPMGLTPYIGGGVGGAEVQLSGNLDGNKLNLRNAFVFAWQAGAGVSMPVSDDLKLFLDYRYFAADGARMKLEPGFKGGDISTDFDSHSILVGLRLSL